MILRHAVLSSMGLAAVARRESMRAADLWASPDGSAPDFSTIFYAESAIDISWRGGVNNSYADLWVAAYDFTSSNSFSQLLTSKSYHGIAPLGLDSI
jgi:hypothetical protein